MDSNNTLTKEQLIENVFKQYEDPELHIDVWTLGLIYEIIIEGTEVKVKLTFTTPFCPFGPQMVDEIEKLIYEQGATSVDIQVTFDPPWKPSEELREMLL